MNAGFEAQARLEMAQPVQFGKAGPLSRGERPAVAAAA